MATDLTRIGTKARQCPTLVFTSLYHHVTDIDNLRDCFTSLDGRKAVGVDGQTKAAYAQHLEENLCALSARLARLGYRPQPKRRTYVPKPGSGHQRPLGISCLEDKIVEEAVKRVLELLWEPLFLDFSYGYRPQRNPHQCVDLLGRVIQQHPINHVVEADIRGFFDHVNHAWLIKFVAQRVGDPRMLRLLRRMLKSGIMEDGLTQATDVGTPQGSIVSPLLSNIYLHYVLDLWFDRRVRPACKGHAYLFRFADDFVVCFEHSEEAGQFQLRLQDRLEGFQLELAMDKTRTLMFGRYARRDRQRVGGKPAQFDFLGFSFYCGKTRRGAFKVKRRTSRKKIAAALARFTDWIRKQRHRHRTGELLARARSRVQGHLNFYAVTDNSERCQMFQTTATRILFKWLNRRSQRKSYNWDTFNEVLRSSGWPTVRITRHMCPFRALPNVYAKSRMWESRLSGSVRGMGSN
ncbi:MAG: group II intron reverse transcriptase/maturase [bacterium]|nr:group II intron reverse transcriptase/maturase [bacterium]